MPNLKLSLGTSANSRVQPVIAGAVRPQGIDLVVTVEQASALFWRQLRFNEFDVSEMSISSLLAAIGRGDTRWVGLPIFSTRHFFHTWSLIRTDTGIEGPPDLRGKRVGVPEYQQTAALWSRGILKDEFGVRPEDIEWHMERTEEMSHGGATGFRPPAGIRFHRIPPEKNIGTMMAAGELDATLLYITANNLTDRSRVDLRSHPKVRPLFPDPVAESIRFFRKTGIFPINHCVAVKRTVLDEHPWVALNLVEAYQAAKESLLARAREVADVHRSLGLLAPEAHQVFATDPYPYGVSSNRKTLEAITRYSHDQGLTPRVLSLEEVFAPSTMDL